MAITLTGVPAVVVSKLTEFGAALLYETGGGLPVQTLPRKGIFYEGHVRSVSPEGSRVLLDRVTEYSPCDHPDGYGLHTREIEDGKTVGIDTLQLTITLPPRARR